MGSGPDRLEVKTVGNNILGQPLGVKNQGSQSIQRGR